CLGRIVGLRAVRVVGIALRRGGRVGRRQTVVRRGHVLCAARAGIDGTVLRSLGGRLRTALVGTHQRRRTGRGRLIGGGELGDVHRRAGRERRQDAYHPSAPRTQEARPGGWWV